MKASEKKFVELFESNKRYTIPVYQRNYSWTIAQCKQLWNDLEHLKEGTHFFGSVVLRNAGDDELIVIDGQQRLTTVSLLWAAMLRFLPKDERVVLGNTAYNIFTKLCYAKRANQFAPRIDHVERDAEPHKAILDDVDISQHMGRVVENFDFFLRKLKNISPEKRETIYNATCRLAVVRIELGTDDNPQLIFESLNATGLQLKEGDKIRNYLLLNAKPQQQEAFYKHYWVAIENCVESTKRKDKDKVTFFFREYMAAKEGHYTPLENVYPHFKNFAERIGDIETLLKDAARHARILSQFANAKTDYASVNTVARRIAYMGFSTVYPFAMNVLTDLQDGNIKESDAEAIFLVLEAYLARRIVCGLASNSLNGTMPTLYAQMKLLHSENDARKLSDAMAYILEQKQGARAFPTDERFAKAWETKEIYTLKGDVRSYLLAMLNATMNSNGYKGKGIVIDPMVESLSANRGKKAQADNTIEHVMPQTLSKSWETDLGGEKTAKATHERWLHTVANLTITGYNSELSNKPFLEKVRCGFAQSSHPINDYIKKQTHWGEAQLEERLRLIADNANRTWPRPDVGKFNGDMYDYLTLDNAPDDFTGTKFVAGTVCGEDIGELSDKTWVNVLQTVTKMLNVNHHEELTRMANDAAQGSFMRNEQTKDKRSCKIDDGIFARFMKMNAVSMTTTMRAIADYLAIDRSLIRFKVQPTTLVAKAALTGNEDEEPYEAAAENVLPF